MALPQVAEQGSPLGVQGPILQQYQFDRAALWGFPSVSECGEYTRGSNGVVPRFIQLRDQQRPGPLSRGDYQDPEGSAGALATRHGLSSTVLPPVIASLETPRLG